MRVLLHYDGPTLGFDRGHVPGRHYKAAAIEIEHRAGAERQHLLSLSDVDQGDASQE